MLAAGLIGCAAEEASEQAPAQQPAATAQPVPPIRVIEKPGDGARATRRIADGCEPVAEARRYQALVGQRAAAILSWNGQTPEAADLRIPVYVVDIEDGSVGVRVLQIPMREQYIHVWLGSGHIQPAPENVFRLDPCSATLEPWPADGSGGVD